MITLADIQRARASISGVAARTSLIPLEHRGHTLYLKPENQQPVGAFKIRGAYNKIASLTDEERARGVIAYSSGNHAQGVAYAARALKTKAVIVMPRNAPEVKRAATEALGAEVIYVGPSGVERMVKAEELAAQHGYTMIPPYDDLKIIAGQGTLGLEIVEDFPAVDLVLVPVGGGGLISGVATAVKALNPSAKVVGVEPEVASDARASLRAGEIVTLPAERVAATAADGLRAMYVGTLTFEHIRHYVDDIVTVSEDEISEAVRILAQNPKTVAEPSGAVAPAAWLFHRDLLPPSKATVAVISGGNIDPELLERVQREAVPSR
ncbi:MAG TPA: threonine/serine dehydratase [Terriglobales bacterium]|jgi:threonine dehydratase|nr:threonine/serine dehydratase [Terriglobales bacterium]HXU16584.1 threonine/serine dehydratase [Terriglobales bacterium]